MRMEQKGYKAGIAEGESIVRMVNLFYQNDTARHFYIGLIEVLTEECEIRGLELLNNNKKETKNG